MKYLFEIKEHLESVFPQEGCGIITQESGWIPCDNILSSEKDFLINPDKYLKIKRQETIEAIVHSHTNDDPTPSSHDISYCNALGIPYYIFAIPSFSLVVLEPEDSAPPLLGRTYLFGVRDCFTAVRDYYKSINIDCGNRNMWQDGWWKLGSNYMNSEEIESRGFKKVTEIKPNDLLVFSVSSRVPNHIGIYVGDGNFFHHAYNRLSCIEPYQDGVWSKFITGIYRYET